MTKLVEFWNGADNELQNEGYERRFGHWCAQEGDHNDPRILQARRYRRGARRCCDGAVDYIAEGGDLRELFAYYLTELPAAGWQGRFDVDPTGAQRVATTQFEGEGTSGNIMFDDNRGPVLIRIFMTVDH